MIETYEVLTSTSCLGPAVIDRTSSDMEKHVCQATDTRHGGGQFVYIGEVSVTVFLTPSSPSLAFMPDNKSLGRPAGSGTGPSKRQRREEHIRPQMSHTQQAGVGPYPGPSGSASKPS